MDENFSTLRPKLLLYSSITCAQAMCTLLLLTYNESFNKIDNLEYLLFLGVTIILEYFKSSFVLSTSAQRDRIEYENLEKSSKNFSLKNPTDCLKCTLLFTLLTIVYIVAIVLFGASVLTNHIETALLAITLSVLTLIPAVLNLGVDNTIGLINNDYLTIEKEMIDTFESSAKMVLVGTWFGAFVIPLDWDRSWQVWPKPCILGAWFGYFLSHLYLCIKICNYRLRMHLKRIK